MNLSGVNFQSLFYTLLQLLGRPGGALVNIYRRKREGYLVARYFDYAEFMNGVEYQLHPISSEQSPILEPLAETKE